jgi:hypothetical protein
MLAGVLVATGSCKVSARPGYVEDDKKATVQAIEAFHQRLSAAQFEDIYREAHQAFRDTGSREQLLSAMRATHDRFGAFQRVTSSQLNVFVGAPVQIRAVYNTNYEKGDATEQFTFLRDDGHVRLALYSPSLGSVRPSGSPK